MTSLYRPSGPLNWLLDKLPTLPTWSLIGTNSAEERSIGVLDVLLQNSRLNNAEFLRVEPSTSRKPNKFRENTLRLLDARQKKATRLAGKSIQHHSIDLLCREEELIRICRNGLNSCGINSR